VETSLRFAIDTRLADSDLRRRHFMDLCTPYLSHLPPIWHHGDDREIVATLNSDVFSPGFNPSHCVSLQIYGYFLANVPTNNAVSSPDFSTYTDVPFRVLLWLFVAKFALQTKESDFLIVHALTEIPHAEHVLQLP
jgi:hypothetical protein